jgi:hypothetical protein
MTSALLIMDVQQGVVERFGQPGLLGPPGRGAGRRQERRSAGRLRPGGTGRNRLGRHRREIGVPAEHVDDVRAAAARRRAR